MFCVCICTHSVQRIDRDAHTSMGTVDLWWGAWVSFSFNLANEASFVRQFFSDYWLNGIFAGLLWMVYVIKWRNDYFNKLFRGTSFQSIIFVIDMSFDFVYTIFPLTLYNGDDGGILFNTKALATLSTENGILFFAAFWAMILLFRKCYNMLKNLILSGLKNVQKRYYLNI